MYLFYSAVLGLGLVASLPYWLFKMLRTRKYRAGLSERLGRVPRRLVMTGPGTEAGTIWFHAVSVGEVIAISTLIHEVRQRHPRSRILVSTTTDTGQKLARE